MKKLYMNGTSTGSFHFLRTWLNKTQIVKKCYILLFRCTIANILTANVIPIKGNVKGHSSKVFEITFTSYYQPAIFTIMFNISYKLVFQNENYKQSLRNYNINKDKLDGVFIINECGNYKPVSYFSYSYNTTLWSETSVQNQILVKKI